jgi:hypothetical protein
MTEQEEVTQKEAPIQENGAAEGPEMPVQDSPMEEEE